MSSCFVKENINAVIHVVLPYINGGLFDAFEYYAGIYEHDPKIYLFYIMYPGFNYSYNNISSTILKDIMLDKYNIKHSIFHNMIFLKKPAELIRYKFNKVLILDNHTLFFIQPILNVNECYVIIDPFCPSNTDYQKLSLLSNYKCYSELLLYAANGAY